ncbi:16S rRNA (guanine(527)-N(7))-methyltransferase RsmG [Aestuariimicrobium sp. T2.26MG-19.2B]|uniref:16S rRNA (guanine(527)-N(7))-methyltransferase RsmG n=1 Tax=Aestuariimicrobium sp. T2.26MG-19.2B TaxID=3040679 RepID=UPI0024774ECB|nr:16S rRNA (guanine(527)-N(7))-methyltransferase RsmG [Aestuariimicrobium sp. T2.26MG-19.2B]CAI9403682.1 Ribosomal RNA small subunit methyltransferase G [Aestuariimicrobium sp. T2.26MG-19.2B]
MSEQFDGSSPDASASGLSAEQVAQSVFGDRYKYIKLYVDILRSRGIEWGLLGPREFDRLWDRHVLNSAALSSVIAQGVSMADVGSGAGLPGIPLAILRPDLEVVLVESLLRRANFLELAVDELRLRDRVTVVRSRAEDWKATVDVVTCRAVAPLPKLLAWTKHLWLPQGRLVALKGSSVADEVDEASRLLDRLHLTAEVLDVRAHPAAESTTALIVHR